MNNPGIYSLTINNDASDLTITTAATTICDPVTDLEGMTAITVGLRLAYGSGGTSIKAYLQTSLNQGTTWIDIACILFGTSAEHAVINLSGLTPKTTQVTPSDGALADDTCIDGILGDRLRLKAVSVGTYGGSTVLEGRVSVR